MRPRQEQSWLCVSHLLALPICAIKRYPILKYDLIHTLSKALSFPRFSCADAGGGTQPPTYLLNYLKET